MDLKDIGVVVLSHGRTDKLEKSLRSYEENGLADMVGDNFIFFNEISNDDINLISGYEKYEWGGHQQNLGIGWGMVKAITESNSEFILFLENDFELDANKENIYSQLNLGLKGIKSGEVDIIKYRKLSDYITTSNEVKRWVNEVDNFGQPTVNGSAGREGCDPRNWWVGFAVEEKFGYENTDICELVGKDGDENLWKMSAEYFNWSNNPFLCRKDWFLDIARSRDFDVMEKIANSRSPDFEEQMDGWWQKQPYFGGILSGIFLHQA